MAKNIAEFWKKHTTSFIFFKIKNRLALIDLKINKNTLPLKEFF